MRWTPLLAGLALGLACGSESGGPGAHAEDAGADAGVGDGAWPDQGGGEVSSEAQPDAEAGPPKPPPGNALLRSDGSVVPLYPVTDPAAATRAIGFVQSGTGVQVLDEDGGELAKHEIGAGSLFGGFDFDADGWPDLGVARSKDSGQICGATAMLDTWLDVVSTKTGKQAALTSMAPALCWTFGTSTYPTTQWSVLAPLFGAGGSELALAPYYAQSGSFAAWSAGAFQVLGTFQYPSTASFDSTYTADQPNAWGGPASFLANSHVANGLVVTVGGQRRLAFFTSGRVVQYAVGQQGPGQLLFDTPYVTGDRKDLAGRNYGLVLPDPGLPTDLVLVAGTGAHSVYDDMVSASMTSDPWGQIERHVSRYDLLTGKVLDRFFSYAHDDADGNKYEGRVAYPANPMVRAASGPSRLAFNVYEGGHWMLHVTQPGSLGDALVLQDLFLWDIADLDRDGIDEWLVTPSRDPSEPDVPGYYYVKWRTQIAHFDATKLELSITATHEGMIPRLAPTFRQPARTSSMGYLYPALVARTSQGLELCTRSAAGKLGSVLVGK
ncbi:MAG: hypothetical protein HS104_31450 [Polyangiaceae bacterium]|nr:hypothetical protein [Polyangiaceae bacterium]MCL4750728.1 hypothetical protein [Myxococcales bacterium]